LGRRTPNVSIMLGWWGDDMPRTVVVALVSAILLASGLVTSWGQTAVAVMRSTSPMPIVVGGDGDSLSPGVAGGFEAGIYRFNRAGGLDGRKIKFTGFLDDEYSAQTNLNNAQQLVENEHVMAVVPFVSAEASGATSAFLAAHRVPFIGWATNTAYLTQPRWGLPIDGSQSNPVVSGAGGEQVFEDMVGAKSFRQLRLALIAENVAPGVAALDDAAGGLKTAGADVVYEGSPIAAIGTTNYAPYAQAIIAAHPNVVFEVLDVADSIGLAAALKAAGYKGAILNGVTYLPGQLASQPDEAAALDGVYVVDEFPADENNTPAVQQARKDLVSVDQPPDLTSGVSQGYWSAIVFEQMLRATLKAVGGDPSKVTGAALQQTVNDGFTYMDPLPGGIGTEHFPAAEHIPTGCETFLTVVGTRYRQIAPYRCSGAVNWKTGHYVSEITGKPIS
jgi:ABC-type branched-subunit amino acid transport system substrate-binding protein